MDAGFDIDDEGSRTAFEAAVLTRAQSETPGRLRPIARIIADRVHPRSIDERHADARLKRAVTLDELPDGMAQLIATVPAVLGRAIMDRLSEQARAVKAARGQDDVPDAGATGPVDVAEPVDERSMDELRADILCDLLLIASPTIDDPATALGAIRATVQVTVPVLTLAGRSGGSAALAGHGPIDSETARILCGGATGWDRVMTHPVTGAVLAVDRYRPSEELKRALRVRDEHCRFPGCRMPVRRCDLDNTRYAALGGETNASNLAHLCKRHHPETRYGLDRPTTRQWSARVDQPGPPAARR